MKTPTHLIWPDHTMFGYPRLTCRCSDSEPTVVRQPYMTDLEWDHVKILFKRKHPRGAFLVIPGSHWQDWDVRIRYQQERFFMVVSVSAGYATTDSKRRIRLDRFKMTSSGYKPVED